jgi:hypothetical protein
MVRLAGIEPTTPWFVACLGMNGVNEINDLAAPSHRKKHRSADKRSRKSRKCRAAKGCRDWRNWTRLGSTFLRPPAAVWRPEAEARTRPWPDMLRFCGYANKQNGCHGARTQRGSIRPMYITDLTHFLDQSGAIGPVKGPARAMAQFHVDLVAHTSDNTSEKLSAPKCFKCKKATVHAILAQDNAVVWACPSCRIEGRVSNWRGSLWDLSDRPSALT